jgi:hypothetical protein
MAVTTAPGSPSEKTQTATSPVLLDLGKQRRKRIKQLRRREAKLMDEINGCIEELRTAGTVNANCQPIVIVVREKRRKTKSMLPLL